jgi:hypothetical protein
MYEIRQGGSYRRRGACCQSQFHRRGRRSWSALCLLGHPVVQSNRARYESVTVLFFWASFDRRRRRWSRPTTTYVGTGRPREWVVAPVAVIVEISQQRRSTSLDSCQCRKCRDQTQTRNVFSGHTRARVLTYCTHQRSTYLADQWRARLIRGSTNTSKRPCSA